MTDLGIILTILGSFISLLLMVNAFFTRETLLRVVKIEVKLEANSTRQSFIENQSNNNHEEIMRMRDRLHSLEGGQAQLLQFVKDMNNQQNQAG